MLWLTGAAVFGGGFCADFQAAFFVFVLHTAWHAVAAEGLHWMVASDGATLLGNQVNLTSGRAVVFGWQFVLSHTLSLATFGGQRGKKGWIVLPCDAARHCQHTAL